MYKGFWWREPGGEKYLEDQGADVRILKQIHKKRAGGMDWTDLAQDWDRWRTLVNAVMNIRFHKTWKISRLVEDL